MSKNDVIWIEGEKALFLNMQRRMDVSISSAREALRTAGMNIVNDAKTNLRNNGSVVTGQLRASGRVQAVIGDEDAIDVGFFSDKNQGGYAYFVENGRRSGKMPPVDYIVQWVKKKMRLLDKEARSVGFLIARKIAKEGTTPHPFFGPAVEKNKKAVTDAISEAVKKETERNG